MRRLGLALVIVFALSVSAGVSSAVTKPQAVAVVRALLKKHAPACGYRVIRVSARPVGKSWRVDAVLAGGVRGTASWVIAGRTAKALNPLGRRVIADCPTNSSPPTPSPAAPPPPPPPSLANAPATYVFGLELSATQQEQVRRGFDAGFTYFRNSLGRELPPFSVWAYADVERMIAAYAESRPTSAAESRRLWEGGQVGHAGRGRKAWLGPRWFANTRLSALKIAAHESFHLLQYEVTPESLWFGGIDDLRAVGPWWLLEGSAEYFAYLAVVSAGDGSRSAVQGQWETTTARSSATLRSLATYRGQLNNAQVYDIYALAVQRLVLERDPKAVLGYFDAVGRGTPWPDAFASAFGRTVEAFYDEFEAYRRTL